MILVPRDFWNAGDLIRVRLIILLLHHCSICVLHLPCVYNPCMEENWLCCIDAKIDFGYVAKDAKIDFPSRCLVLYVHHMHGGAGCLHGIKYKEMSC